MDQNSKLPHDIHDGNNTLIFFLRYFIPFSQFSPFFLLVSYQEESNFNFGFFFSMSFLLWWNLFWREKTNFVYRSININIRHSSNWHHCQMWYDMIWLCKPRPMPSLAQSTIIFVKPFDLDARQSKRFGE